MNLDKRHHSYLEDLANATSLVGIDQIYNKSFLITGATGLIGTFLIDALMYLNKKGANISVYAVGRNREKASLRLGEYYDNPLFCYIEQDVRNPLPSNLNVDYIIPLASNTHPLAYSQFPVETIDINVKGAEYALQVAERCYSTVLYPSSVEIYGNARGTDVFTEDYTGQLNLSNARSCYPESKRISEALCQSYCAEKGVDVKIARLSRIIGPTMLESDSKASTQFIMKALRGEDVVLKSKGEQFYSYTYVADVVNAFLFILIYGQKGEAYNVASEKCNIHLRDFANLCACQAGKKVIYDLPSDVESKGYSIANQAIMDSGRLEKLGWVSKYDISEALRRILDIIK